MTASVLILRPQPGADRTAERARALGLSPVVAPLFTIRPLAWSAPDAADFDCVMLTSANAARQGGGAMTSFLHLPCFAVGGATAAAAAEAGFADIRSGPSDGAALLRMMAAQGALSALHPCGLDHLAPTVGGVSVHSVPVYAADSAGRLPPEAQAALAAGAVALIHSPRAGALFGKLAGGPRERVRLVAISEAAALAAGSGWAETAIAAVPRDEALLELAAKLCQTAPEARRAGE